MELFRDPITLNPWGHNFCKEWFKSHRPDKCPKWDSKISSTLSDEVLDDVVSKYL